MFSTSSRCSFAARRREREVDVENEGVESARPLQTSACSSRNKRPDDTPSAGQSERAVQDFLRSNLISGPNETSAYLREGFKFEGGSAWTTPRIQEFNGYKWEADTGRISTIFIIDVYNASSSSSSPDTSAFSAPAFAMSCARSCSSVSETAFGYRTNELSGGTIWTPD